MNFRQDVALTMAISVAVVVACLLTWAACHWWYGRKLAAAAHRLHKSDKERAFSRDQTQQARRQLQQVKAELESHQRNSSKSQALAARHRSAQIEEQRQAAERAAEADSAFMPIVAAHGFADTQILPD